MRYLLWTFALLVLVAAGLLALGWRPPYHYNPWALLDPRADPDWLTRFRLYRIGRDPARCQAALVRGGASFSAVADKHTQDGCGWQNAVMLRGTGEAMLERPALVTCPLAISMVMLDLHVLQPTARASFGSGVGTIAHVGSYNCRNVKGDGDSSVLSSHAQARAIDVTGFRLANGRMVSLAKGWQTPMDGAFLRDVESGSCGFFGIVLGPDYNAAHAGHFHLEVGSAGWCR